MLTLTNAQRVALLDTFVSWTLGYLGEHLPMQQLAPRCGEAKDIEATRLRQAVERVCECGLAAGLEDTRLLLRLVLIAASAKPAFLQDEQAVRILQDRSRHADQRLDALAQLADRSR